MLVVGIGCACLRRASSLSMKAVLGALALSWVKNRGEALELKGRHGGGEDDSHVSVHHLFYLACLRREARCDLLDLRIWHGTCVATGL